MKLLFVLVVLVLAIKARVEKCGRVLPSPAVQRPANRSHISYAVMFDAGSTGTRIHVYAFIHTHTEALPVLENEKFHSMKPGLSAHIHYPETARHSVRTLLKVAERTVPRPLWKNTPVMLRATAGLRLMSAEKARALLREVRRAFNESPFLVPDNSVAIMDGISEGILAWVTVNFLSGHLHAHQEQKLGILDLGGASTQITFLPKLTDFSSFEKSTPAVDIVRVDILNSTFRLYTHSYLGNGLMAARLSMLSARVFKSPCLPRKFRDKWTFGGETYQVSGDPDGASGYKACYEDVFKTVKGVVHHRHLGEQKTLFYAFSYYFDRAVDAHLIHEVDGGLLEVRDFRRRAKEVCKDSRKGTFTVSPFLCLDLTYISCLLTEGLGFKDNTKLQLSKKVNNVEASWALGATLDHFKNLHIHLRERGGG
ncbi:ectonucleoside triphosphate diphosphohydrolase 5-like [Corythoichthys intestinalis]|uniref:ectonucleoside triphosphate diphosphohydrolase 5-like n=1 Tax=Corythoichthys intestinalis TaxID=161448 RepID=UPI0025A60A75|nr:ectonucleoside triphosphate diphosphohydrolase 5-like [Corythoichthys intestinalis]XP_057678565.1 ectonucleoside triphosphate diphosphohydrolase 5-like [Corythoichthys intestinalis]